MKAAEGAAVTARRTAFGLRSGDGGKSGSELGRAQDARLPPDGRTLTGVRSRVKTARQLRFWHRKGGINCNTRAFLRCPRPARPHPCAPPRRPGKELDLTSL